MLILKRTITLLIVSSSFSKCGAYGVVCQQVFGREPLVRACAARIWRAQSHHPFSTVTNQSVIICRDYVRNYNHDDDDGDDDGDD